MKSNKILPLFTAIALLYACNSNQNTSNEMEADVAAMNLAPPPSYNSDGLPAPSSIEENGPVEYERFESEMPGHPIDVLEKKLIKDGNISIQTGDIEESKKRVDGIVKSLDAYLEKEEMGSNDN